jgi:hypothetical protein
MKSPEKPRHVDSRITHVDLLEAFGNPAGIDDLASLRAWVGRDRREALWPAELWAAAARGTAEADAVIAAADALRHTPPDVTGAGLGRSQRYGFHYLGWLQPSVQAWALTGDKAYAGTFADLFGQWVERRDGLVGEWPGLDLVWYSLGTWARARLLLPALDAFGDALPDRTWAQAMGTVVGGARWAYDEHDAFRHGNWQLVSASQLLHVGAIYPRLVEADAWVRRGRQRLVEHLDRDFYADGGHYERSPGYHAMCLEAVQLAAAVDKRYLEGGLDRHPRIASMHAWLRELTSSDGWVPHLQDSGIVWSGPLMERGSELLSEDVTVSAAPTKSVLLAESGYAVLRAADLRVVVNCGPYVEHELESHSHRAVLDFVLEGRGRPLLWEAGGPPSYDDPRYQPWFQSARGHNVLLVDGRDLGTDRDVVVEEFGESPEAVTFTGRHRANGVPHRRQLVLVRTEPSYLVVRDTVEAEGHHSYELLLHAPEPWTEADGYWRTASIRVWVDDRAPTAAATSQGEARLPNPHSRSADYAPLYTLTLTRTVGAFTTVVAPIVDDRAWSVDWRALP